MLYVSKILIDGNWTIDKFDMFHVCKTKLTSAGVASSYKSESYPSIATNSYDVNYRLKLKKKIITILLIVSCTDFHLIKQKFFNKFDENWKLECLIMYLIMCLFTWFFCRVNW